MIQTTAIKIQAKLRVEINFFGQKIGQICKIKMSKFACPDGNISWSQTIWFTVMSQF